MYYRYDIALPLFYGNTATQNSLTKYWIPRKKDDNHWVGGSNPSTTMVNNIRWYMYFCYFDTSNNYLYHRDGGSSRITKFNPGWQLGLTTQGGTLINADIEFFIQPNSTNGRLHFWVDQKPNYGGMLELDCGVFGYDTRVAACMTQIDPQDSVFDPTSGSIQLISTDSNYQRAMRDCLVPISMQGDGTILYKKRFFGIDSGLGHYANGGRSSYMESFVTLDPNNVFMKDNTNASPHPKFATIGNYSLLLSLMNSQVVPFVDSDNNIYTPFTYSPSSDPMTCFDAFQWHTLSIKSLWKRSNTTNSFAQPWKLNSNYSPTRSCAPWHSTSSPYNDRSIERCIVLNDVTITTSSGSTNYAFFSGGQEAGRAAKNLGSSLGVSKYTYSGMYFKSQQQTNSGITGISTIPAGRLYNFVVAPSLWYSAPVVDIICDDPAIIFKRVTTGTSDTIQFDLLRAGSGTLTRAQLNAIRDISGN